MKIKKTAKTTDTLERERERESNIQPKYVLNLILTKQKNAMQIITNLQAKKNAK